MISSMAAQHFQIAKNDTRDSTLEAINSPCPLAPRRQKTARAKFETEFHLFIQRPRTMVATWRHCPTAQGATHPSSAWWPKYWPTIAPLLEVACLKLHQFPRSFFCHQTGVKVSNKTWLHWRHGNAKAGTPTQADRLSGGRQSKVVLCARPFQLPPLC